MMIQMHSKKPLPDTLRSTFELPVWPYREGPGQTPIELRDYLKQFTIFRYEDNYTGGPRGMYAYAIMIPDENGTWAQDWESPIECYQHMLFIDDETLEIIHWPNDNPQGFALHRKIEEATGDTFAWSEFNKKVELRACNSHVIAYTRGHNTPGNISNITQMKQPSPKTATRYVKTVDKSIHAAQKLEK